MKQPERMNAIMHNLSENHNASTHYLRNWLGVSQATVRRDIDVLASLKKDVRKVHGGVVLDSPSNPLEHMFEFKLNVNVELKRRVARAAVSRLEDNDSVIIESGRSRLHTATELHRRKDLRVATVDLQVAIELAKHDHTEALIVGGLIRPGYCSVGDTPAIETLDRFSADRAAMSVDAIDLEPGVTNFSIFQVRVKRKLLEIAGECILAASRRLSPIVNLTPRMRRLFVTWALNW